MEQNSEPIVQPEASTPTGRPTLRGLIAPLLTARGFLLFLATVLTLSIAYYFVVALPAHNRAMLQLERDKFQALQLEKEQAELDKKFKEDQAKTDAAYRERMLGYCLAFAEEAYWSYVKLNGTAVPGKKDVYRAPSHVWEHAAKQKKEALEECHRQWDQK